MITKKREKLQFINPLLGIRFLKTEETKYFTVCQINNFRTYFIKEDEVWC